MTQKHKRVLALCGGVGGSKLAEGLSRTINPENLTVVVNTGDDFTHLGLQISPDLDTVMYTLAGLSHRVQGWGLENETWQFMDALSRLGGESWFRLGDRDLAMHVSRTCARSAGTSLTRFTRDAAAALGIRVNVLPMTDHTVRTVVATSDGDLAFQNYFVERKCEPCVKEIRYEGAESAQMTTEVSAALSDSHLDAIIICPSNPYLSIDPILAVPGIRAALRASRVPVIAVSCVVAGASVKGPTAKIMKELGVPVSAASVATHYGDLIDGFIVDCSDEATLQEFDVQSIAASIVMTTDESRAMVAETTLEFAEQIRDRKRDRAEN